MEAILTLRETACSHCGGAMRFRLSRFGCVYACVCGAIVDFQKVLQSFVKRLREGELALSFFPVIEGMGGVTTDTARRISVEVDCEKHRGLLVFHNIPESHRADIVGSLPLALLSHMQPFHAGHASQAKDDDDVVAFPLELLEECVEALKAACADLHGPEHVFLSEPHDIVLQQSRSAAPCELSDAQVLDRLPHVLAKTLKKHQVRGIAKMLAFSGRALLADDMGIGKTLQALGVVSLLGAFPLLIICPSAVKVMWAEEIEKYLFAQVPFSGVHLIHGSNTAMSATDEPNVVVISYHMAAVLASSLQARQWGCVVCDESHLLRTNTNSVDAHYTTVAVKLCQSARYCLLLSGTPALSSPFDMYNQLSAVRPDLFGATRWDFALRYTRLSFTPYIHVGPCTREAELTSLLRSACLLRRMKADVLDLPSKTRLIVRVVDKPDTHVWSTASFQSRYAHDWTLKRHGILEAVAHFTEKYSQVVLFAHHLALLDELARSLKRRRVSFVRIDGAVAAAARSELVGMFDRGEVRVALMGITACAVGISLASAQCAVFCELPPDAAWLSQAEDRLHRLGQVSEVVVYYLLGVHSSFDALHFSHLLRSHHQAHGVVNGQHLPASQIAFQHAVHVRRDSVLRDLDASSATGSPGGVVAANAPAAMLPHPLQFAVSRNTGRIHVRAEPVVGTGVADVPAFYWSASLFDAQECIRERTVPFWAQLGQFLQTLDMHSPRVRRKIEQGALWLPCDFTLKRPRAAVSGSTARYAPPPLRCGWGFWWLVRRHYSAHSNQYFAPLQRSVTRGSSFVALCLQCATRPASLVNVPTTHSPLAPGAVVVIDADAAMFCGGACREAFYTRRSSGALRRSVLGLDQGICTHCHVDCERLCFLLASTDSEQARVQLIEQHHPHLAQFPTLVHRLVQHPIPGNCWHADHVIPVSRGGGEAALDNIQTLCVACHALKTQEDNRGALVEPVACENAVTANLSTTRSSVQHLATADSESSRITRRRYGMHSAADPE